VRKVNRIVDSAKKTVVFLGGEDDFCATGFFIGIQNCLHLVTAKHVVFDSKSKQFIDDQLIAYFNLKHGGLGKRSVRNVKDRLGLEWVFHPSDEVDIALIPFEFTPEEDDVRVIPTKYFLEVNKIAELFDVFFPSYQPGIQPESVENSNRITPVLRVGAVSIINTDRTFYIDGAAFPGNSGSPVFVRPSRVRPDIGRITVGEDSLDGKFVGVIGSYVPYREVAISAQTRSPRVVFEENTGLSKVWSAAFIREIIESEGFREQFERVKSEENVKEKEN
jgi:hypothetical protein